MAREVGAQLVEADKAAEERRWDDAVGLLEAALAHEPEHVRALDLLGYVRFCQGRYADAERACRRALALRPDHAYAHKGLGLCLARQGQLDDGVASLEQAIALRPAWFDPHWDLAVVLLEAGRPRAARDAAERGAQAVPTERERFLGLAREAERRALVGPAAGAS